MVTTQSSLFILHLSLIDGIGPGTINTIIMRKPDAITWDEIYSFSREKIARVFGLSSRISSIIHDGLCDTQMLKKEIAQAREHNIRIITVLDEQYPSLLKEINLPPAVLYVQGADLTESKALAVIGSRQADWYGKKVIAMLIPDLVRAGFTIVSGGALGADSMAHEATLAAGGNTIVVLGSGLLKLYPQTNEHLFNKILSAGGSLVSAFSLTTQARPGNFPARNRIIAGLSRGCIVVQAAEQSGARITAQYALEQGRDVFAVPGPLDNLLSVGCHALIQDGAKLAGNAHDILVEYNQQPAQKKPAQENVKAKPAKQKIDQNYATPATDKTPPDDLVILCRTACSIDDLATQTNHSVSQLGQMLFDLQLEGKITQDFTGKWQAQ